MSTLPRIAIVGDYEGVQATSQPVEDLRERAEVTIFSDPIPVEQVAHVLADFSVVIAIRERTPFPAEVLDALPDLELISQSGTHAAHVDLAAASRQGVAVACGPAQPGKARDSLMPELVFGLLFGLTRDLAALQPEMARGGWPASVGRSVRGLTLGILGLGRHGQAVAAVAKAFGMRVIAWGPTLDDERASAHGVERREQPEDLLPEVDVLSIHLKLSELSRDLLDARRLDLLPSHAIIINTARGAIIDEAVMASRLADGRLGGAGLDVFTTEPLPVDSPLRTLDNVLLTPHVGWIVDQNLVEFAEDTVGHAQAYLDGALQPSALLNASSTAVERQRVGGFSG